MNNSIKTILFIAILVFACEKGDVDYSSGNEDGVGTGGSLARFTITNNYLYTVDYSTLKVYDITNEKKPVKKNELHIGFDVETIFSKGDLLLMGSRNGVYIYDISNPDYPALLSLYTHTYSCDPVVVSGNYAYSTLSTSSSCNNGTNELDIINVSNPENPSFVKAIQMENPHGLGVSGNLLFVCDNGIKVFNITDKENPLLIKTIGITNAINVIPIDSLLLVASESGLSEYKITSDNNLTFLSNLY
jgi:hypothetical protein